MIVLLSNFKRMLEEHTRSFKLLITFLFMTVIATAQNPGFEWAKKLPGDNYVVTTDAAGNLYTGGGYRGSIGDFDPGPGTYTMSGTNSQYAYIVKLDATGNFSWARSYGATTANASTYVASLITDAAGNIYACGYFQKTVDFDPGPATYTLTSSSIGIASYDAYISKFDASGNFLWARQFVAEAGKFSWAKSVDVDAAGNVYACGDFSGTVDFDPGSAEYDITAIGYVDVYVLKLDPSGNLVWAKPFGTPQHDRAGTLDVDVNGDVVIAGYFYQTVDFDPGPGTYTLTATGFGEDVFVWKLDANANFMWAKQIGGSGTEEAPRVTTDLAGNVLITGRFTQLPDLDPGLGTYTVTTFGGGDIFVVKLDVTGNFVWGKQMGGTTDDVPGSITTDIYGGVYLTGYFEGTADFNPTPVVVNLTSAGTDDVFLTKLNAAGNFEWAKRMGSTSGDEGRCIHVDAKGNLYTSGVFSFTVDFNPNSGVFNLEVPNEGVLGASFVQKLSQCLSPANATPLANKTLCANTIAILSATGYGTVNWYATPTGTTLLASGTSYTTSALSAGTYTFYAEASTCTVSASRTAITVTVNALPNITVNSGSICTGNSFTINPNGANTFTITGGSSVVSPTSTASYSVAGTSAQGCVSSNTAISSVTVNTLPQINITTNNNLMCTGESAVLTATGAVTYIWSTTENTSSISISPTVTTTYTVNGVDANGCKNMSTITQSVSLCTGIVTLNNDEAPLISVYPNPNNGIFTIHTNESVKVTITNLLGEIILTETYTKIQELNLQISAKGLYFIKATKNGSNQVFKMIIE